MEGRDQGGWIAREGWRTVTRASATLALVGQALIKEDVLAYSDPEFRDVVELVRGCDFAFTGYEGTIRGRHGGWPMKSSFLHVSEPLVLDSLRAMGFDLLSLANNHAFDLGPSGILSTLEEVRARGFVCAGAGETLEDATRAGVRYANAATVALVAMDAGPQGEHVYATNASERMAARPGSNRLRVHTTIRVAPADMEVLRRISREVGYEAGKSANDKVGYRQSAGEGYEFFGLRFEAADQPEQHRWVDPDDARRNLRAIEDASRAADVVIAYLHHHHWEPQWERVPSWFRGFARECVDAGASVVVSHGVPMLQGIEVYRGAPLFFGLGNFIFHTFQAAKYTDERIWQSVVAKVRFHDRRCAGIDLHPVVLGGEAALREQRFDVRRVPHRARACYGESILRRLAAMSADLGTRVEVGDGLGTVRLS